LSANQRRRQDYLKLPESERALLDSVGWKQKVAHIDAAIERNAEFLLKIIDDPMIFQGMDLEGEHGHGMESRAIQLECFQNIQLR
jgi:carnosine N-methyltransferase